MVEATIVHLFCFISGSGTKLYSVSLHEGAVQRYGTRIGSKHFFSQIFCCDQQHNCKYNVSIIILASQISIYTDFMQWKLFLEKCDLSFMNRISASLCILVSIFSNYNFELNNPPPSQEKAYTCLLIQHIKKHFPATQN